jgi:hypothetical protein
MHAHRSAFAALLLLCGLSMSWSSQGHQTIPKTWCANPDDRPEVVSTFQFKGKDLEDLIRKCGIVDKPEDHWHSVKNAIAYHCQTTAPRGYSSVPFITGPETYNSELHHEQYRISDGLTGGCAVCITAPP